MKKIIVETKREFIPSKVYEIKHEIEFPVFWGNKAEPDTIKASFDGESTIEITQLKDGFVNMRKFYLFSQTYFEGEKLTKKEFIKFLDLIELNIQNFKNQLK